MTTRKTRRGKGETTQQSCPRDKGKGGTAKKLNKIDSTKKGLEMSGKRSDGRKTFERWARPNNRNATPQRVGEQPENPTLCTQVSFEYENSRTPLAKNWKSGVSRWLRGISEKESIEGEVMSNLLREK